MLSLRRTTGLWHTHLTPPISVHSPHLAVVPACFNSGCSKKCSDQNHKYAPFERMTVLEQRKTKAKSKDYCKPRLPCFSKNMKINRCEERQYSLLLKPSSNQAKVHNPPQKDTEEGASKSREKASPYSAMFPTGSFPPLNTNH